MRECGECVPNTLMLCYFLVISKKTDHSPDYDTHYCECVPRPVRVCILFTELQFWCFFWYALL